MRKAIWLTHGASARGPSMARMISAKLMSSALRAACGVHGAVVPEPFALAPA